MTEVEQKRLYEHFKKLSVDGKTDIQRVHAKEYAAEILKSFPQFEKRVPDKTDKVIEKATKEFVEKEKTKSKGKK